ncbi:hypothetical protein G4Y73_08130 [Wenzhouxiangella sp. XN201]|uniref:Wzz/FepE/Etk N-terminal domain-containing protein n=1 Tax=Wenzhouxiangella sp. XN201 TaxID=2710755 RepID=UPI0013C5D77B|nr:Wzz/FepE/Etk N-terminal domain-containing protein [Wenzhouxiangella sp. XN201]NEZ04119.1 hypothetical protein [Wenzhouxiangella sp. XN201]
MTEQDTHGHAAEYYEDEISLVDLAIGLWEQKWVVIGVAVLCTLLGVAYAVVRPLVYEYATTIEIGTRLEGSETQPVEPPGNVVAKLERNYIPEAIRTFEEELQEANGGSVNLRVSASSPRDTNLVVLTSEGADDLGDYYIRLHERVVGRLASDHERDTKLEQVRMRNQLEEAQLRLEELTDERVLKVERQELQNRIIAEQNKLENLAGQQELLEAELENLDVQEELVQNRLEELSEFIAGARERRAQTQTEVRGGAEGMALMLIDNELQRDIDRQTELEERLLVEIPESRASLRSQLADNQREQSLQRETIDALEAKYEKLLLDQEHRLPQARAKVEELETRLANLRETRAVLPPRQSLNPVGSGRSMIVVLSVVLGLVLGVFAALMVGFVGSVRKRLSSES